MILLCAAGRLAGFSTLAVRELDSRVAGRTLAVMFSGDTVIDHEHWGSQKLPFAFGYLAGTLAARTPHPLYWLLVSKGHRTYRYLPLYVREYWPRHDRPTPRDAQRLVDEVADAQFGEHYRAAEGVVRFAASRGHLKPCWGRIRPPLAVRPEVSFFLARNPRYLAGEELVCLAPFRADNLRRAVRDGFEAGAARGLETVSVPA